MSATMGFWECRHGVDGRDRCEECYMPSCATCDGWRRIRDGLLWIDCPDCGPKGEGEGG